VERLHLDVLTDVVCAKSEDYHMLCVLNIGLERTSTLCRHVLETWLHKDMTFY